MNDPIIDQNFVNQNFSGKKLPSREYDTCEFINCDFIEADISVVAFISCTFIDCNFTKVLMKQTSFRDDCVFEGCQLIGVNYTSCNDFLFSVEFKKCNLNYASFYNLKMKNTRFSNTKLIDVDFTEADISGVLFKECDLTNAIFESTIADKTDFRTAINFTIDPTQNQLKKAKFSRDGLMGLLYKFDFEID